MEITFKFSTHERVLTPFGDEGIVEMCAVDRRGNRYLVLMKKDDGGLLDWWFDEGLLSEAKDKPRI